MALTIVVRSGDAESPPSITFDAPRIVIGRGEGSEVRLPDPSVSHRHASIRQRGSEYIVLDEGSTNGTFVGPVGLSPQSSRVLKSGDRLRVGRVWLEIVIEQAPASAKPQLATKEIALGLVASALKAQGQDAQLVVCVVEGPDAGLELELTRFDKQYIVGRGNGVELQLSDADASRRHVALERKGDQVKVADLGSKNGAAVAGRALGKGKSKVWKPGEPLKLGATVLKYDDPVAAALVELEAEPDEPIDDFEPSQLDEPPDTEHGEVGAIAERPQPVAPLDESPRAGAGGRRKRRWWSTDLIVAGFALVVLGLSALGLFWVFGGK